MNPPPAGDALPAFDFLSEFLPAPDFGESFGFNLFNFDDAGDSPLLGGYDNDSCSFSVESYVRNGRRRRKKRRANRIYRKQSVLLSPWYVNFLEELTNILVERGYIAEPRSLQFCAEFRERSELLVLTALYRLGRGNSYLHCRSNTFISISEIRIFFVFSWMQSLR